VEIEAADFGNSFNRAANISDSAFTWTDADDDSRLYGGFITDNYGLIDSDGDSFGSNIIW
jgi:hypothetical protein